MADHEHGIDWTPEWKQAGREEGRGEGREEGMETKLQEARTVLLEQIEQRFGPASDATRQKIAGMTSIREIMEALARAIAAPSPDALELA